MVDRIDQKIVLFSGGSDSTALLYKLLNETTDKLHVHHIELNQSSSIRYLAEEKATREVLSWCRNNFPDRPFSYSESSIRFYNATGPDHYIWALHGGMLVAAGHGNVMYTGRIATDDSGLGSLNQIRAESIFKIVTGDPTAKWELPIEHLCKRDLIRNTPKELFELSWSCRTPILFEKQYKWCYHCIGCLRRIEGMWQSGLYERDEELYEQFSNAFDKKCPTIMNGSMEDIGKISVGSNKLPPLPTESNSITKKRMFELSQREPN